MKTGNFPYLASGMGLFLLLLVVNGSRTDAGGETLLPLLTLLIVNEFAFIISAIGAFIGIRHSLADGFTARYSTVTALCVVLGFVFAWLGIKIWPL